MSGDHGSKVDSLLSDQEIESLRLAQDLYGARAKEAAAGLAETLGLNEDLRNQLIGGVALKLEGRDFEERRRIAEAFQELSAALGGAAVKGTVPTVLDLLRSQPAEKTGHGTGARTTAIKNGIHHPQNQTESITRENADPLTNQSRSWLSRVFDEEDVAKIEALDKEQRLEFTANLTRQYQGLKIPRLGKEAKQKRGEQLSALLSGKTYKEIAHELGIQESTLRSGMTIMAGSITSRLTPNQLKRLIPAPASENEKAGEQKPDYDPPEDIGSSTTDVALVLRGRDDEQQHSGAPESEPTQAEATDSNLRLNKEQIGWLKQLFDDNEVRFIAQMSDEERQDLASALGEKYQTLKINRLEPAGRQRRIEIMQAFLKNKPYQEIAQDFGMRPYALRKVLDSIACNFNKKVAKAELCDLLPITITDQQPDTVNDEQPISDVPQSQAEKIESESDKLNKLQIKWLRKVFDQDDAIQMAEGLTAEQREYLAERLGRHVNSAVIRSQGPARTARRLQEISLLLKGSNYEEIAALVGTDVGTVKQELHHSAQRLKSTTPAPMLINILRNATLHTEE